MRDFTVKKRAILTLLSVLIGGDIALAVYGYQLASAPQKQVGDQTLKLKVLQKDIESAQHIKDDMPSTRADCDKFEQELPLESIGYSSLTSDLDTIAKKAGLQILTLAPKQKELSAHPLAEVHIDMTVNGDYASVARFINGLQRSEKFYIVDDLTLSESQGKNANGNLSVALHLRTYFREAA